MADVTAGSPRPDYYAVLGVRRDAEPLAIKQAFRRLAGLYHPDRHQGDERATARFQALVEAYEVLGRPESRAAHDSGRDPGGVRLEPGSGITELLGQVVDQLFGVRERRPRAGRDREYRLEISFEEMALGAERSVVLPRDVPCPRCDGRGFPLEALPEICERCAGYGEIQRRQGLRRVAQVCDDCLGRGYQVAVGEGCAECDGSGQTGAVQDLTISIPSGVRDGAKLRIRGAGEPGTLGAPPGDCLVIVSVRAHAHLTRDGDHLRLERPVDVFRGMTGGWLSVPTVEGPRRVRLSPATRHGSVLRMTGLGVRRADGTRGDQLVAVHVEMPEALDEALVQQLQGLAERVPADAFPRVRDFEVTQAGGPPKE